MSTRHIAAEDARLADLTPEGSSNRASKRFRQKLAADGFTVDEGFKLKPGYLYTVVRAISARVNQNWDGWPSEELKKSYKTFIGKPVFVNHENHDPTKARGVVIAARYVENGMDRYIEVVQEIDAGRFPKLAHEIKTGGLDSVSMGAEAGFTICSYCHNKATDMDDMCDHVLNYKGKTLSRLDRKTGKKEEVLVFESCHKISFFELSYVFEPADETAVASKVVVAGKRVEAKPERCRNCGKRYDDWQGYCKHCDYDEDSLADHHDGMVDEWWSDPDDEQDPFDPRIIGAGKVAGWSGNSQGDLHTAPSPGHELHVFSPHVAPEIVHRSGDTIVPAGGNNKHEWVHTHWGEPVNQGVAGSAEEAIAAAEASHRELAGGFDPDDRPDPFDPRIIGASRRTADDVTVPAPPGVTPIEQSVIDMTPVINLPPATELDGHEALGLGKQSGKYTKEDFAAAGNRKPWETSDDNDEEAVREIEAMLHKHSADCIPGVNCHGTGPAIGEQIGKDTPNNPVNQKSSDPNGTGGSGGSGSSSSSGYQGNGKSGRDGLNPAAMSFYDQLAKDFPGASMGGYNPTVDQPWDEHQTGDAFDFMTSDLDQGNAIRDRALANGAKHVIWQQTLWYPGGGSEKMEDRHSPTENHYDHVHINMPTPSGFKPSTTSGGASPNTSQSTMMQATPTGLVPMQRAASRDDATISALVCDGGIPARRSGAKLAASLGSGRVPKYLQGLVGTWIRHSTLQFDADGKPMRDANGRAIRVPAKLLDPSKPVFVHYNFPAVKAQKETGVPQPHLWSIEQDGYVRGYTNHLHLAGGPDPDGRVALTVQKSGADKAMRTERRNVHAGAEGFLAPVDDREPLPFSKINYDPFRQYDPALGTNFFYHEDDYDHPVTSADEMHFSQYAQMHGFQADNWGRPGEPQLVFPPPPDLNASNPDTVRPDIVEQAKLRGQRPSQRSAALKKIARRRAMKLAWGETEAPMAVDTLREEGSAPEDDNDDFERYVDPPKDLQTPDLSQAQQVDREQELQAQGGGMGEPGAADPNAGAVPQQQPQQQFITLQIPMPAEAPQVPQAAVPPQAQMGPPQMQQMMPPQGQPQQMVASQQSERKCPHCGIKQYDDNPHTDPLQEPQRGRCWKCSKPLNPHEGRITASMLDYFDRYFGRRVANWMDAIEAGRGMTPEETADYRRQAGKLSTLENSRELSTTNRNPTKGTAKMARSTNASRSKVADGPLVDGGDRSRNDQGEQEEAFISQTPPEGRAEVVTDDTQNISNTEHNLVARVQRGREQLLRDAQALAAVQRKRALSEAGGPTAEVVDPRVNAGRGAEELTGDDFISADPNDGVVPTNPKDASLRAFAAFDSWLAQKTGKSSRRHSEASIKKAAAAFSREAGISPQMLFPALGIVLREARKNDKQANTKGAKMRKRSNESLSTAAPDARIDVTTPVKNTDAEAQASQFDLHDFGNNAGDNVANPDLSTDQNWAPGEASKKASIKTAGGLLAMRCAEGMIEAGLEPNSRERKYQLAAEFEQMNRGLIQDRVALLERFAAVRQADLRKVASGSSRGAARSPIPAGLGGGNRTASAGMRTAAHDPSNDSGLFI